MENASKALIIAGAILLSILIIAIGMYIYTSSHNSISEAGSQISEQEKTSFNQQWNTYEGKQGGDIVKALLQKIIANCNTNAQEDQRLVDVELGSGGGSASYGIAPTGVYSAHVWIPITVSGGVDAPSSYDDLLGGRNNGSYNPEEAVKCLTMARNGVLSRHTYTVSVSYSPKTSLVDVITIEY